MLRNHIATTVKVGLTSSVFSQHIGSVVTLSSPKKKKICSCIFVHAIENIHFHIGEGFLPEELADLEVTAGGVEVVQVGQDAALI